MKRIVKVNIDSVDKFTNSDKMLSLSEYNLQNSDKKLRSLRSDSNDKLIADDDDTIVQDPYFAKVLNKNREVKIGDFIYQIMAEGVVGYQKDKKAKADEFIKKIKNKRIKLIACEDYLNMDPELVYIPEECLNPPNSYNYNSSNSCNQSGPDLLFGFHLSCEDYYGGSRRTKGVVWSQNFGIYSSFGVKTKHQSEWMGIWWGLNANYINWRVHNMKFGAKYPDGTPYELELSNRYGSRNNDNKIVEVFDENTAVFKLPLMIPKKLSYSYKVKKASISHRIVKNPYQSEVHLKYNN